MCNRYKVFILEGLPGTGKTTLLERLANDFDRIIPEIALDADIKLVDGDQDFFIKNDIEKMDQAKSSSGCVLMDRWFASTLAYNHSRLVVDSSDDYRKILRAFSRYENLDKRIQYLYIYLDIDPLLSLSRKRYYSNPNNNVWTQQNYLNEIKAYYDKYFLSLREENRAVIINCRDKNLDVIAREIKAIKINYYLSNSAQPGKLD